MLPPILLLLLIVWCSACKPTTNPTTIAEQPMINDSVTDFSEELVLLEPYGMAYNQQRQALNLYPIPTTQVQSADVGQFSERAFLKWKLTLSYRTSVAYWVSKTIYLNDKGEVLEKDVFQGVKRYAIFNMAREDSYVDRCPTLDCDNPPTILTNERLTSIFNYQRGTWLIEHKTVNPEIAPNYYADREQTKALSVREMQQLLREWGLK